MRATIVASLALALAATACTHKKKPPVVEAGPADLSGLAAIPASARVVIGVAPARLAGSDVVARAFRRMLERDPDLAARVDRLARGCDLDWGARIRSIHVALTDASPKPLLVATGQLSEADLARCVRTTVGAGGGSLTAEQADGRTLYHVDDAGHEMYFAFGQADTVVLSGARELVLAGLGAGDKVLAVPAMKALVDRADTAAPLWAVGRVDDRLGQRLLRLTRGKVAQPPVAFLASLDPTDGLSVRLSAVTRSGDDAKALESQVSPLLALVAVAAQAYELGPVAAKVTARADGDAVHIEVTLTDAELKEVLSTVDSSPPSAQDAGPSAISDGSATHGP